MDSKNLSTLQINALKNRNQFDKANAEGRLSEDQLYLTPVQDIDHNPEDGSENLITSGGVYDALNKVYEDMQNIDIPAGFNKTGRLIEIDGNIINSTLGKSYTTTHVKTILNQEINALTFNGKFYYKTFEKNETHISFQEEFSIIFDYQNNTYIKDLSTVMYNSSDYLLAFNCNLDDQNNFEIIDNSIPYFALIFSMDKNTIKFISKEHYNKAKIIITQIETITNYIRLPDGSLGNGDFIEIKDGVISSTLGRKIGTKIIQEEEFNLDFSKISCEEERFNAQFQYYFSLSAIPNLTIGNKINIKLKTVDEEIVFSDLLIEKSTISGAEGIIIFANTESYDWEEFRNTGITKINENLPAFVFMAVQRTDTLEIYGYIFIDEPFNYTPYFSFLTEKEQDEYVTLPNSALSFDKEPTEGSTNLITSGDLYEMLGDVSSAIEQISVLIGGASQ